MKINHSQKISLKVLWPVLVLLIPLVLSCGKKDPTGYEEITPAEIEVLYSSGRPIITWQTDKPATGSIFYGTLPGDYTHFAYEAGVFSLSHSIRVIGAESGITYFFAVRSKSPEGLTFVSEEKTFKAQADNQVALLEWTMLNISEGIAVGDCHYIRTPNGYNVVIDSGSDETVNTFFSFCSSRNLEHFNLALITHLHLDHYGGFINGIFDNYSFDSLKLAHSHEPYYNWAYSNLISSAQSNSIGVNVVREGDNLYWDPSINVSVIHAGRIDDDNENNSSVVLKISYGEIDFILTGDAEIPIENMIMDNYSGYDLNCEVLKVGHHGKNDATSDSWLEAVNPETAVIPVDQQSSYGGNSLPSESVIMKLRELGIDVFRSDKNYPNSYRYNHGHITLLTGGQSYEISIN